MTRALAIAIAIGALILVTTGCGVSTPVSQAPVEMSVTGTGTADVSVQTDQGSFQKAQQFLPFNYSSNGTNTNGISAQSNAAGATITCTIKRGDTVLATQTSEGAYTVVNCNAPN